MQLRPLALLCGPHAIVATSSLRCQAPNALMPSATATTEAEQRIIICYRPGDTEGRSGAASSNCCDRDWEGVPLTLNDPKSGQPAQYMRISNHLQEVNWYKERFRSWFVGDAVIADGGLYLSTPVDPLFLALPILEASRRQSGGEEGAFQEREQLLQEEACRANAELAALVGPSVAMLCDVKAAGGCTYYRLSDAKVLAWLRCKLKQLRRALAQHSASHAALDEASLTAYAVRLLGEYLPEAWFLRLCDECGVAPVPERAEGQPLKPVNAEPLQDAQPNQAKRARLDAKEVARMRAAENKAEARAAQVRRETRGMKSISSLFGKYQCKDKDAA